MASTGIELLLCRTAKFNAVEQPETPAQTETGRFKLTVIASDIHLNRTASKDIQRSVLQKDDGFSVTSLTTRNHFEGSVER